MKEFPLKEFLGECRVLFSFPQNIIVLMARWLIAYGFAIPALAKINNLEGTIVWFEEIYIPFPVLAAYLVSSIETLGIILLVLGLFTRYISILLACVMLGAILFVHLGHGFSAANNGIEIPLYYFIFLVIFASFGAGKYSLDHLLFKNDEYE